MIQYSWLFELLSQLCFSPTAIKKQQQIKKKKSTTTVSKSKHWHKLQPENAKIHVEYLIKFHWIFFFINWFASEIFRIFTYFIETKTHRYLFGKSDQCWHFFRAFFAPSFSKNGVKISKDKCDSELILTFWRTASIFSLFALFFSLSVVHSFESRPCSVK